MSDVDLQGQISNAFINGFIKTKSGQMIPLKLASFTIFSLHGLIKSNALAALEELKDVAEESKVSPRTMVALGEQMCIEILRSTGLMPGGTKKIIDDVLRLNLVTSSGEAYRLDTEHYFSEFERVAPQGTKVTPSLFCSALPIFVPNS